MLIKCLELIFGCVANLWFPGDNAKSGVASSWQTVAANIVEISNIEETDSAQPVTSMLRCNNMDKHFRFTYLGT